MTEADVRFNLLYILTQVLEKYRAKIALWRLTFLPE